jgi:multidrug efflux pump subunit AcrB
MKSLHSSVSAVLAMICTGCQPAGLAPPPASPPAPAQAKAPQAVIWVTVDSPDGSRSARELFQTAEQTVAPTLKKLPAAGDVQILGSPKQLAIADDMPAVLIKVSLQIIDASAEDFRRAFTEMKSLPVAVNIALDETIDRILTIRLQLPEGSSAEDVRQKAERAIEVVEEISDVAGTVTYFDADKSNIATLLVQQTADRPAAAEVQLALTRELPGVKCEATEKPLVK